MIKAIKDGGIIYTCFKIGDYEIVQEGKYYNYITKEILKDMLFHVKSNAEVIDYWESITNANIDRPKAIWGNYLIRKKRNIF